MKRYSRLILAFLFVLNATGVKAQQFDSFVPFLPDHSESFVFVQVQKIFDDPGASWFLDRQVIEQRLPPAHLGKVEWLAIAGSTEEIINLQNANRNTFEDIADQIGGEAHLTKSRSPASVLNRPFVALIHFQKPVGNQSIVKWLAGDEQATLEFQSNTRNGYQVLECVAADTCKVVRIDERTIIVGGREEIEAGLARKSAGESLLCQHYTSELLDSEFRAVMDVTKVTKTFGASSMPIKGFDKAEWLSIKMDFSGPHLFAAEARFNDSPSATEALNTARQFHDDQIDGITSVIQWQQGNESNRWITAKTVEILNSMTISEINGRVVATVPRPDQWVEIVAQFVEHTRKIEEEMNAQFAEIAKELDSATEAAAKAAFESVKGTVDYE